MNSLVVHQTRAGTVKLLPGTTLHLGLMLACLPQAALWQLGQGTETKAHYRVDTLPGPKGQVSAQNVSNLKCVILGDTKDGQCAAARDKPDRAHFRKQRNFPGIVTCLPGRDLSEHV